MTIDERAEGTAPIILVALAHYQGDEVRPGYSKQDFVGDLLKPMLIEAIKEAHRDWAHALMTAVEERFPLPGGEWREWPTSPDVAGVCAWLRQLVDEIRKDEREACAAIAENPIKIPDEPGQLDQHAWPGHPVMKAVATAIRARTRSGQVLRKDVKVISPHAFKGRLDRDCETCGLPDRAWIHRGETPVLYERGEK